MTNRNGSIKPNPYYATKSSKEIAFDVPKLHCSDIKRIWFVHLQFFTTAGFRRGSHLDEKKGGFWGRITRGRLDSDEVAVYI